MDSQTVDFTSSQLHRKKQYALWYICKIKRLTYVIEKNRVIPIRIPIWQYRSWNSSCSLQSSTQKADTQQTWCQNWQNLSLDQLINSFDGATSRAQEITSVRFEQSGNTGSSSMYQWRHVKVSKILPSFEPEESHLKDCGSPLGYTGRHG